MNRNIGTLGSIAALLLGSSAMIVNSASLEGTVEVPEGNSSYVNSLGDAVKTGLGDCLITGTFSEDSMINACEGIDDAAADADGTDGADGDAAAETAVAPAPAPKPAAKAPIVTSTALDGEALFGNNSADLNSASEQALATLVTKLETFQEISAIEVVGHSDSTGDAAYNLALSERRAASVEDFLKAAYPNVEVTSSGMGEDAPVATNSTSEGRAMNRRVEVKVTAKSISE